MATRRQFSREFKARVELDVLTLPHFAHVVSRLPEPRLAMGGQRVESAIIALGVRQVGILLKRVSLLDRQGVIGPEADDVWRKSHLD